MLLSLLANTQLTHARYAEGCDVRDSHPRDVALHYGRELNRDEDDLLLQSIDDIGGGDGYCPNGCPAVGPEACRGWGNYRRRSLLVGSRDMPTGDVHNRLTITERIRIRRLGHLRIFF